MDTAAAGHRRHSQQQNLGKDKETKMEKLKSYLANNTYPGRGILIGSTETDTVIAYFIMGRSQNSRNRIFVETDDGIVRKVTKTRNIKYNGQGLQIDASRE